MLNCTKCGETKTKESFSKHKAYVRGYNTWCKTCIVSYGIARQKQMRDLIQRYKRMKGCVDCGYNKHPEALDLDHLPQYEKKFNISGNRLKASKKKIKSELAKCEVVCANCHRVRSAYRR